MRKPEELEIPVRFRSVPPLNSLILKHFFNVKIVDFKDFFNSLILKDYKSLNLNVIEF